jgi:hypothetical protein
MKHSLNRRKFLNYSLKYGLFISLGYPYIKSLEAKASTLKTQTMPTSDSIKDQPVFPFYQFAEKYNIGEYIPKDQGGKFIQMGLFQTEEDEIITQKIRQGLLEKQYGTPIDWIKFEKSELEKSVWINRFYPLPSFARLYYIKKDSSYLRDMMSLLYQWLNDNPAGSITQSKYNWNDMQVAWRAINLSWCLYLGLDGLSSDDRTAISALQNEHAKILLNDFGKQPLNEFNHQSHGALAMLYLATLFPSLQHVDSLKETALKILEHHINFAFYNDGGNVEHMFGYYPFIAHVFRDVELLCRANKIAPPTKNLSLLNKMAGYLSGIAQPDNTVPAINDSYEETIVPTLETLKLVFQAPKETEAPNSIYFADSQFAVIRQTTQPDHSWYINLNPASLIGAHAHAGRLAINAWYNDTPILTDSGCCSYDDPQLIHWYRTTHAHNTVIIDNFSDEATSSPTKWTAKRTTGNKIAHWKINTDYQFCRMVSPASEPTNNHVKWIRDAVLIRNNFFIIHDCFEDNSMHEFETLFHVHHNLDVEDFPNYFLLNNKDTTLILMPLKNIMLKTVSQKDTYQSNLGKNVQGTELSIKFNGTGRIHSSYLIYPINEGNYIQDLKIGEEITANEYIINIKKEGVFEDILKFSNPDKNNNQPFHFNK